MLHLQSHQHHGEVLSPFALTLVPAGRRYQSIKVAISYTPTALISPSSLHLLLIPVSVLSICYQHAQSTDLTSLSLHPHSRHHIGLRDPVSQNAVPPSFNGLYGDRMLQHGGITHAVTCRQSQVLLLLFFLHIKLVPKPRGTNMLRFHLIHQQNATTNSTKCMPLQCNMGGFVLLIHSCLMFTQMYICVGKYYPQQLYFILNIFFLTTFIFISYITSIHLIKLVISLVSIWYQCCLNYGLLFNSLIIIKKITRSKCKSNKNNEMMTRSIEISLLLL